MSENKNAIREAREKAGLTIKQLSDMLEAPYRTVQDWNSGKAKPPIWLQKLVIAEIDRRTKDEGAGDRG